jgi:hypothetical protein
MTQMFQHAASGDRIGGRLDGRDRDGLAGVGGRIRLPDVPGIGFELHDDAWQAFRSLTTA